MRLSHALSWSSIAVCWPDAQRARDSHILAGRPNFAKYSPISQFFFSHRLGNKPFLIWLLTASPHLKYADTIPSNLSLRAYFADINVSQGSVARYARCGGIFDIRLRV